MIKISAFGEIIINLFTSKEEPLVSLPKYLRYSIGGEEVYFLANISNLGGQSFFISVFSFSSSFSLLEDSFENLVIRLLY